MKKLAVVLAVALAGCLDLEQEYTFNADGSGKVVVHSIFPPTMFEFGEKPGKPEDTMKKAIRDELQKAQGVDAWTDVSGSLRDDGKIEFRGTAYFKDYSRLKLHNQGTSGPITGLTMTGDATGWVLEAKPESKGKAAAPAEPVKLSDEELKTRFKAERAKYQQMKPFLESFLKESRVRVRMNLPGKVSEVSVLEKPGDSTIAMDVEGKKLIKALDDMIMDDAFLKKMVESGKDLDKSEPDPDLVIEKMFGKKGPVRAVVKGPLKDQFNYEAAAAPARGKMEETLAAWGAKPPAAPIEAAKGGALKSVKVAGIQLVHFTDDERDIRPLNGAEGMTLAIVAELPGSVLSVKEGKLTGAKADNGEDLLPEREFDRDIHFPHLSKDRAAATFDVKLKAPSAKAKGIKSVSGVLTYVTAGKTKAVDLGIAEFKAEAKGKALGAQIEKIEDHPFEKDQKMITIKLEMAREGIDAVEMFDAAGKKVEMEPSGYSSFGDNASLSFTVKGAVPAKGKIVARVFDELKSYEVPFTVENLDLLGRPLK